MKQEMMGWQWHQLDHMQIISTSLQTDNRVSISSLKFLHARCSSWRPTNSIKVLMAWRMNGVCVCVLYSQRWGVPVYYDWRWRYVVVVVESASSSHCSPVISSVTDWILLWSLSTSTWHCRDDQWLAAEYTLWHTILQSGVPVYWTGVPL